MRTYRGWLTACALLAFQALSQANSDYSIENPGADLANFPNSAFTVPQNHAYLEMTPVNYSGQTPGGDPAQYAVGALLRYGVSNDFEIRLSSDAYVHTFENEAPKGFGGQAFAVKWHVADAVSDSILPAFGIEVDLNTDLAKFSDRNDLLPSLSLNFDQALPGDVAFEYNVGFVTQTGESNQLEAQLALAWAFQREIFDKTSVFIHGYANTVSGPTTSAIGGGLQWIPSKMFTVFSNLNAGLTRSTPDISTATGFAVAF